MWLLPSTSCKLDPSCLPDKTASTRLHWTPAAVCFHADGHRWRRMPQWPARFSRSRRGPSSPRPELLPRARLPPLPDKDQVFQHPPPNLQVCVEGNQMWRGMRRRLHADSNPSHQIPILQFKICPPLSEFTSWAVIYQHL